MMRLLAIGLALISLLAAAAAAYAGAGASATVSIGIVDMERIGGEYQGMLALNQQFQDFQKQQEQQLAQRHKSRLLFDVEQREYMDLPQSAPTPERDKRLTELEQLSDQRERRLFELRDYKSRNPQEEAEYQQLNTLYESRMKDLNSLQEDLQKARLAKYEELTKIVTDSVNAAVKAVAEAKKLNLVLRKEMVLYGGVDISDDVIAKLNAKPAK